MIFVGGGAIAADASEELMQFAEKVHAPVSDSLMGKEHFREQIRCMQVCWVCMEPNMPTSV